MNKDFGRLILITGVCSVGLATLSIAEDRIYLNHKNTTKNSQLNKFYISSTPYFEGTVRGNTVWLRKAAGSDKQGEQGNAPQDRGRKNHAAPNSIEVLGEKEKRKITMVGKAVPAETPQPAQTKPVPHQAIALVKEFEGFSDRAYADTDGTPVIGYGLSKIAGKSVKLGDKISSQKANWALEAELRQLQRQIDSAVKVKLSESQLSALMSLSFNVGFYSIQQSTLVKKLNQGDYAGAANEFLRWNKANVRGSLVPLAGLTRRRQVERQLFLE